MIWALLPDKMHLFRIKGGTSADRGEDEGCVRGVRSSRGRSAAVQRSHHRARWSQVASDGGQSRLLNLHNMQHLQTSQHGRWENRISALHILRIVSEFYGFIWASLTRTQESRRPSSSNTATPSSWRVNARWSRSNGSPGASRLGPSWRDTRVSRKASAFAHRSRRLSSR